jgi:hypothetical protein
MKPIRNSECEAGVHPTRGPNNPAEFFKSNFTRSAPGVSFKTVKAKFSPKTIHAEAKKAGVVVRIEDQSPWLKVTILKKLPPAPPKSKNKDLYFGAGKEYQKSLTPPVAADSAAPAIDIFS